MESRKDTSFRCWWCGSVADSREHILKKSDIKRVYGSPPYSDINQPFLENIPGQSQKVQGPNSKKVKFKPNLCQNCNNARSSSFDKSYDQFVTSIGPMFNEIYLSKTIDLTKIYGDEWMEGVQLLRKYLIKHIGCRIAHEGDTVPKNLIDFLDSKEPLKDVIIEFEVRPLMKAFQDVFNSMNDDWSSYELLNAAPISRMVITTERNEVDIDIYVSWLSTSWLSFNYVLQEDVRITTKDLRYDNPLLPVFIDQVDLIKAHKNSPDEIKAKQEYFEYLNRFGDGGTVKKFYDRLVEDK